MTDLFMVRRFISTSTIIIITVYSIKFKANAIINISIYKKFSIA